MESFPCSRGSLQTALIDLKEDGFGSLIIDPRRYLMNDWLDVQKTLDQLPQEIIRQELGLWIVDLTML